MTTRREESPTDEKRGKKGWSESEGGKQMVGNIAC